jgi:putative ABC transport system permease protein
VAYMAVRLFVAVAPAGVPRLDEIGLNATALAGALGITAIAMLVFGLAPAVIASRVDIDQALRSEARQSASRRSRRGMEALVAGQVALALVVLSAAGLIARSLIKLEGAELSFEPSRLLIGDLTLRYAQYDDPTKQRALLERLLSRLEAIPGVRAVSPVVALPFSGSGGWDGRPAAEGQSAEEAATNPMLNMEVVTPAYFETFSIPVIRGRRFTDQDREGGLAVVMVSQSAARHYWPGQDPVGKRLRMGPELEWTGTVVGVVPDTRYRDLRSARPSIYFPLRQSFFPYVPMTLAVRTNGPPAELVGTIRRVISESEPGVALASAAPFETFLDGPLAQPRLNALLLALFAAAAVTLAAVGLFGAVAAMVRQRTRELGVRMALGASPGDLGWMVMRRGLTIATLGSALGLLGALLANRLLSAMLYEVTPTDVATLAAVTGFLLGVATLAILVPAQATTRIDPAVMLRAEG